MSDRLDELQEWYASQCNGDWEHSCGVTILTSDNPAWNVTVDLAGTDMDGAVMAEVSHDNGHGEWMRCNITDNQFGGVGDPSKLGAILDQFFALASAHGWRRRGPAD